MTYVFMRETRRRILCLWTVCLLLGLTCVAQAQESAQLACEQVSAAAPGNDPFADVRALIQQEMAKEGIPGMAVAVARDGKILWEEGFGWANIEKKIPATPHTMFLLASVSKPYTATGLMLLVEQGKIDLDAPINNYLPKDRQLKVWIGDPKDVTVRRVANHTAGLDRHEHFFRGGSISAKPSMAESIRRYGNIVRIPGERYRYSNFDYGILSHLIECVSRKSFPDFMRSEVFLPLGMTRSSVGIRPSLEEYTTQLYSGGTALSPPITDHAGASEVYASMHDMVRFGMFHLGQLEPDQQALLSDDARAAMRTPTATIVPIHPADTNPLAGSHYGIGWVLDDNELGKQANHIGGLGGASSKILLMPDEGIVIVSAANQFGSLPEIVDQKILAVLLPDYPERVARYEQRQRTEQKQKTPRNYHPTSELMGDWKGQVHTYEGSGSIILSFKESGETYAQLGNQAQTQVSDVQYVDGRFMGRLSCEIHPEDSKESQRRHRLSVWLDLTLRGDVLNGAAVFRRGGALSHWVELRRQKKQ